MQVTRCQLELVGKKIALEQTEAKGGSHMAVRKYHQTCKENVDARGMLEVVKAGGEGILSEAKADSMSLQIAHNQIGNKRGNTSYCTVLVRACRICQRIVGASSYDRGVRSQELARIIV